MSCTKQPRTMLANLILQHSCHSSAFQRSIVPSGLFLPPNPIHQDSRVSSGQFHGWHAKYPNQVYGEHRDRRWRTIYFYFGDAKTPTRGSSTGRVLSKISSPCGIIPSHAISNPSAFYSMIMQCFLLTKLCVARYYYCAPNKIPNLATSKFVCLLPDPQGGRTVLSTYVPT